MGGEQIGGIGADQIPIEITFALVHETPGGPEGRVFETIKIEIRGCAARGSVGRRDPLERIADMESKVVGEPKLEHLIEQVGLGTVSRHRRAGGIIRIRTGVAVGVFGAAKKLAAQG